MKRVLLSLFFVFGLINFAYAENEKVTLQITAGVMECVVSSEIGCFGTSMDFDELVTFEFVKDEKLSGEQFDLYTAKWQKDFNENGFAFSSAIVLSKTVVKADTDPALPKVIYSIMYQTGFTPETTAFSVVMKPTTLNEDIFQLVLGGSMVKDGKIYRPALSITNMLDEDEDRVSPKSILKSLGK